MDQSFWHSVLEVREAVNRRLEALRESGEIGSNLEADVDIYCGEEILNTLRRLGDELRFVMITSSAEAHDLGSRPAGDATEVNGVVITAKASRNDKCIRCWHRRSEVGQDEQHPQLCGRCIENVAGNGELRQYA